MSDKKIRVLIVDDSLFFREVLAMHLSRDPEIEVVGQAPDSVSADNLIKVCNPNVLTVDVEMPGMNGIEFIKDLMPRNPIPAVVVSSISNSVFDALDAGAVDFVAKPDSSIKMGYDSFINELKTKIKIAASANKLLIKNNIEVKEDKFKNNIIAIGASTGGTEAIFNVIKSFPKRMPGIVIVQHMPPVFTKMYAERLNNSCALEVKEAENKDKVIPGRVLIAPGEFQMRLKKIGGAYSVECYKSERVNGHCPSVDVLFNSVAEKAGADAIGIILTGMGSDGAKGLLEMRKRGAKTIGQNEATSIVYGMPKVAYEIGAVEKQVPLNKVSENVMKILGLEQFNGK